ncbi:MAG: AAA family ATPase [Armatimonadota bacterium]|nr:AAA family ATPase [bacterium]
MLTRSSTIRVLIAARERELRDHLRLILLDNEGYEVVGTAVDGQEAVQLAVLLKPDIALLGADLPIFGGLDVGEMIGLSVPDVRCILLLNEQPDQQTLKQAMKSGVRACLCAPYDKKDVINTVSSLAGISSRRYTQEYINATDPTRIPKVIVVTGGKGGIGKTTMTASIASCLAESNPGKVAILDLYTQFGDVATMLDLQPQRTLSDIVAVSDNIDLEMLESCMLEHKSTGVKVLTSSITPQPIDAIGVAHAEATLHALKRGYTYIVIDLPAILHATTLYVLANCYRLLIITNMFDMPNVKNAKELLDKVAGTYLPDDKISIIANRVSKHDRLRQKDVETVLGRRVAASVPNDRRLVVAVNQGVPFMSAYAKSPMVEAVKRIANDIIHENPVQKD